MAPNRFDIDAGGLYRLAKQITAYRRMANEEIRKLVFTHRTNNKIKENMQCLDYHGVNERKMMNEDDDEQHEKAYVNAQLWNVYFQHDGALAHKTSSVKSYLMEEFGEQIIGYGGFQKWPPRSPDLTPMDFFLWGYLKQQVYSTPPPTLQEFQ
ncbi:hypothetical protein AVEN_161127-1 [Araneus ventricosus]|uniref:Uncharacterized protein n=1 Tax=Araneus ventricosus TaxID=182803 RepID=A0A4Y2K2A0_ARAVE|nr:hypothetical protein AVEN_161127-1 [Araneus ventricosus]